MAAALLADVTVTNIFMGRLNQGLKADLLGEHVDLEAARALQGLRRERGIKTQLIVASVREWRTFVRVAGCDIFTAPCAALRDFLAQTEVSAAEIRSQLETSYADRLGIDGGVLGALGPERIARVYRVEPELIEFLARFRASAEYHRLPDGERLSAASRRRASGTCSTRRPIRSGPSCAAASCPTWTRRSPKASPSTRSSASSPTRTSRRPRRRWAARSRSGSGGLRDEAEPGSLENPAAREARLLEIAQEDLLSGAERTAPAERVPASVGTGGPQGGV